MNKQVNKTKGFTLIELLIVIAIIGILAGIVVVSLSGSTDAATDAKIKANLRSIDTIWKNDIIEKNDISGSADKLCDHAAVEDIMGSIADDVQILHADNVSGGDIVTGNATRGDSTDNKLYLQNAANDESAVGCVSAKAGWVIWARLSDDSNSNAVYQCIDTSGFSGTKTGTPANLSSGANLAPTCAANIT